MKNDKPSGLLQVLGIGFGIAIVVGNAIGVGILRMPATVASNIGNEWLVILLWTLGGCLALAGSVLYAEAGTAYPFTGGPYAIAEKVFGKQAGFTVGVCDWILNTAGNAALAIAVTEYVNALCGWQVPLNAGAVLLIIVLSIIQWFGIRSSSIIQQWLSVLKALGLLFLVAAFFMHGRSTGVVATATPVISSPVTLFGAIILSFRAILFAYGGWNAPVYFSEENTDPRQNLPKSLIYGVLSLTLIYVLVNAAMVYLLPAASIAGSQLPVADGAYIVFGQAGKTIVTVICIIIVLSSLYAGVLYSPRIIFGVARSGLFFPFATTLNRYSVPGMASIATALITIVCAITGTFDFVISVCAFLYLFIDFSVYVAAIYSRWKNKVELFYKAPGFPVWHILVILVNVALMVSVFAEDWVSSGYAILIIVLTIPLYFVFKFTSSTTRS